MPEGDVGVQPVEVAAVVLPEESAGVWPVEETALLPEGGVWV